MRVKDSWGEPRENARWGGGGVARGQIVSTPRSSPMRFLFCEHAQQHSLDVVMTSLQEEGQCYPRKSCSAALDYVLSAQAIAGQRGGKLGEVC